MPVADEKLPPAQQSKQEVPLDLDVPVKQEDETTDSDS